MGIPDPTGDGDGDRDRQKSYSGRRRKPLEFSVGPVAYRLDLPKELNGVHDTFHVSNLKKCLAYPTLQVPLDEIQVDAKLNFVEELVEILEREFNKLKQSRIAIVKVRWNSKCGPEFTWEREDQMKFKYPHLFSDAGYPTLACESPALNQLLQLVGPLSAYVVPTGRVVVPTGRYVVPAGKVIIIVSPGRLSLVPTGRVLSPGRVKHLSSSYINSIEASEFRNSENPWLRDKFILPKRSIYFITMAWVLGQLCWSARAQKGRKDDSQSSDMNYCPETPTLSENLRKCRGERVSPWEIETYNSPVPTSLVQPMTQKNKNSRSLANNPIVGNMRKIHVAMIVAPKRNEADHRSYNPKFSRLQSQIQDVNQGNVQI
ncbi:hypothetical protein Tco_0826199, partial [Tanacetum coccineum]